MPTHNGAWQKPLASRTHTLADSERGPWKRQRTHLAEAAGDRGGADAGGAEAGHRRARRQRGLGAGHGDKARQTRRGMMRRLSERPRAWVIQLCWDPTSGLPDGAGQDDRRLLRRLDEAVGL